MSTFNTELVIEGIRIDLQENFNGSMTYSLANVQDISTISGAYSKTITVPGTHNNNQAFNYLFDIKSSNDFSAVNLPNIGANFDFKRKARCYVLQDQQVILQGYAKMISVSTVNGVITYSIQINSEIQGLISALGDSRLEDFYPSGSSTPFDHQLTLKNITGSWLYSSSDAAAAAGVPYLYPLIDYGSFDTCNGTNFYTQNLRPALYAKELFDLCMQTASYSYSSSFLSGDYFQHMVIPYKDGVISGITSNLVNSQCTIPQSQSILNTATYNSAPLFIYDQNSSPDYISEKFTPSLPSRYNFNININADLNFRAFYTGSQGILNFFNTQMTLYAYVPLFDSVTNALVDGTNFVQLVIPEGAINMFSSNNTQTFNYTLNASVFMPAGTYAKVGVSMGASKPPGNFIGGYVFPDSHKIYLEGTGSFKANATVATNLSIGFNSSLDGNTLFYNQFVPKDVKMSDYVTSILRLFNLYAVQDTDQPKRLNIFTYDELFNTNNTVLDWTKKIDLSQEVKVTPIPSLDSRNLLFSYRPDNDYYNDLYSSYYGNGVYGQQRFSANYEFNNDTKDVLENSIFSATPCVQYATQYLPCEQTIEIQNTSLNTMQVSGYYAQISGSNPTGSFNLSDNVLTKARVGGVISYWNNLYTITKVINSSQFIVNKPLSRPAGGIDGTYYAKNDTFSYLSNNNKIIPAIYTSADQNLTRQPTKVNPRILYYQGLKPCNSWVLQYTPQAPTASATSSYYASPSFVSQSVYPCVSHLDDYTNPTQDLLFGVPNNVFFNEPGTYPTGNLFTNYWENTALSIVDNDSKLLTAQLKLNSIDVANLDYSNKICIDGTYYRINSINNYSPDNSTTTEVELLRVPFQVYNTPPSHSAIITGSTTTTTQAPAMIQIISDPSVNTILTGMRVDSGSVIYISGTNFPIASSNSGSFTDSNFGNTVTVSVDIVSGSIGERLLFTDTSGSLHTRALTLSGTQTVDIIGAINSGGSAELEVSLPIPTTTTTTTTTGAPASVHVENDNANASVSAVQINGIGVSGGSYPVNTGQSTTSTTGQLGSLETVVVGCTDLGVGSITLTDTNLVSYCQDLSSAGNYTFSNVAIGAGGTVSIILTNSACSPATTTTTIPPTTTTTTAGPTTTTLAPTTTTTTTTTLAPTTENIHIENDNSNASVSSVQVNSISVTGGSFPVNSGGATTATTNQLGTHSILVTVSDLGTGSITLTSTSGDFVCQDLTAAGNYSFTGITIAAGGLITITLSDSSC